jgi:hypothetical protein
MSAIKHQLGKAVKQYPNNLPTPLFSKEVKMPPTIHQFGGDFKTISPISNPLSKEVTKCQH